MTFGVAFTPINVLINFVVTTDDEPQRTAIICALLDICISKTISILADYLLNIITCHQRYEEESTSYAKPWECNNRGNNNKSRKSGDNGGYCQEMENEAVGTYLYME